MLHRLRPRSVYDVFALIGMVAALGTGTAYASHLVVNSSDIVDGEVKNADIGFDAVTGSRIANGAIQTQDIQDFTITGSDFGVNTIGSSKIQNDTLTGDDVLETSLNPLQIGKVAKAFEADSAPVRGYERVAGDPLNEGSISALVECPEGKRVVGGGYIVDSYTSTTPPVAVVNGPYTETEWWVFIEAQGSSFAGTPYALCVSASG